MVCPTLFMVNFTFLWFVTSWYIFSGQVLNFALLTFFLFFKEVFAQKRQVIYKQDPNLLVFITFPYTHPYVHQGQPRNGNFMSYSFRRMCGFLSQVVLTMIKVITWPSKSKLKMEKLSTWPVKMYEVCIEKVKLTRKKSWIRPLNSRLKIFPKYLHSERASERLLETG